VKGQGETKGAGAHAGFASEYAAEQQRVGDASGGICLVKLLPCRREVDVFEIPDRDAAWDV
jgi:hypothetical protein